MQPPKSLLSKFPMLFSHRIDVLPNEFKRGFVSRNDVNIFLKTKVNYIGLMCSAKELCRVYRRANDIAIWKSVRIWLAQHVNRFTGCDVQFGLLLAAVAA